MSQTSRTKFLDRVKRALGRHSDSKIDLSKHGFFNNPEPAYQDALKDSIENAQELLDEFKKNAESLGWNTYKISDVSGAREILIRILSQIGARSVVCTNEPAVIQMQLEKILNDGGINITKMMVENRNAMNPAEIEKHLRSVAEVSDVGITGCDFAVAETGTVVVVPKLGVSRLVSLIPPVHIAVVHLGQVLRSLDELFAVRRYETITGTENGYMNLISGPSRSGDIENIMIQGVHGPGEVHLILVDHRLPEE